jgi:predicted nucleic acid-binding protein
MSFLLDTNIVSVHLKRPRGLAHRFVQYSGRLYVSSVALAELYVACKLSLLSNFRGRVYKGGLKRAGISPDRGAWAKELTGALCPLEDSGPGRKRD